MIDRRRLLSRLVPGAIAALLVWPALVPPPPLRSLHNMSLPMDVQIDVSILATPKETDELRVAFVSNCFFHGAVANGPQTTVLPEPLTLVGRFEQELADQTDLTAAPIRVFNASVDGTTILDHLALVAKMSSYQVDLLVIAMAYTEFRRVPLHPLLGNLQSYLQALPVDQADIGDLGKSRGRIISMDFQRWLTGQKYELYKRSPPLVNLLLWNRQLRENLEPVREADYYRARYGGMAIPVQHIGLRAKIEQGYRTYLQVLLQFCREAGVRVVLVNQPIRFKDVIEEENPGLFAEHRQLLRDAADRHDHVGLVDIDAAIPVEARLSDYIHLTYDGVEQVSQILNPALIEQLRKVLWTRQQSGTKH